MSSVWLPHQIEEAETHNVPRLVGKQRGSKEGGEPDGSTISMSLQGRLTAVGGGAGASASNNRCKLPLEDRPQVLALDAATVLVRLHLRLREAVSRLICTLGDSIAHDPHRRSVDRETHQQGYIV